MIQKYRKKPIVIEALYFNGRNESEIIAFTGGKAMRTVDHSSLLIPTLEGTMIASIGDWIIKGVNGEFYPCKPDIFEKTYEIIEQSDSEYYTEQEVSDMNIRGDNFREYLYGWDDAFVQGKGYLKKYVDMYLTHIQ